MNKCASNYIGIEFKEGAGRNIIATIARGTWPNTIPDIAITLSGCFFTIPFQIACMIVAKIIIKKHWYP